MRCRRFSGPSLGDLDLQGRNPLTALAVKAVGSLYYALYLSLVIEVNTSTIPNYCKIMIKITTIELLHYNRFEDYFERSALEEEIKVLVT